MRNYLAKKYRAYEQKNPKSKPFSDEHIAEELLCSIEDAKRYTRRALNTLPSYLSFDQFAKVIEATLVLEFE